MEIKTKFNIGDAVYFYNDRINRITKGKIHAIRLFITPQEAMSETGVATKTSAIYVIRDLQAEKQFANYIDSAIESAEEGNEKLPLVVSSSMLGSNPLVEVYDTLVFESREKAFDFAFKITEGL